MQSDPHTVIYSAMALACVGLALFHDLRERRIPNRLTATALAFALGLHFAFGGFVACALALCAALVAGGAALAFFLAGGMGGGDVKLMAAVGAFLGLHSVGGLLLWTSLCGGVFACLVAARHGRIRQTLENAAALLQFHSNRGLRPHPEHHLAGEGALRMPFALPIAAGCLLAVSLHSWSL